MPRRRLMLLFGLMLALLLGLQGFDIWREPGPLDWAEVGIDLVEKLLLLGAMAAMAWIVPELLALREAQVAIHGALSRGAAEGDAWRAQRRAELAALGHAIELQFRDWRLTAAEADVAGLMLKGMSSKEIALARATSEATIRQQAQGVYRKSGLSGRAELSAYFLESLFTVAEDSAHQRPTLSVIPGSGPKA